MSANNGKTQLIPHGEGDTDYIEIDPKKSGYDEERLHAYYNEFIGSADASYAFRVKKERAGVKGYAHCFTYCVSDYSFSEMVDKVSAEYGAGSYRLMVYTSRNKLAMNQPFYVAEKLTDEKSPANRVAENYNNDITRQLLASQSDMMERLENALKPKESIFKFENLPAIAGAVSSIAVALKQFLPERQAPMNILETITLIKTIQEMKPEERSDSPSVMDTALKALESFAPALIKNANQDNTKQSLLEQENHRLKLLLSNQNIALPNHEMTQIQKDILNQEIKPKNDLDDEKLLKLKTLLPMCIAGCKKESSPDEYAAFIADQLTDEEASELYLFSEDTEQVVYLLSMIEPKVLDHQQWFKDLINIFKSYFEVEEKQDLEEKPLTDANKNDLTVLDSRATVPANTNNVTIADGNDNNSPATSNPKRKRRNA